jgi:hypothetical protein
MTSEELKDEIDLAITSETSPASITPTDVGDTLKLMVDYVDQEIGSVYKTFISQSGTSNPTKSDKFNTTGLTFDISRQALGVYRLTPSSSITGGVCIKLFLQNNTFIGQSFRFDNQETYIDIRTTFWNDVFGEYALTDDLINNATLELEIYN